MSGFLGGLGAAAARHPWRVIAAWVLGVGLLAGLAAVLGGPPRDDHRVPGTGAQAGFDLIEERTANPRGADARVVVHDREGDRLPDAALTALRGRLATLPHVTRVDPPQLSPSGVTALVNVRYGVAVTEFSGSEGVDALRTATAPLEATGVQVELGGLVPENFTAPGGTAEIVGVTAALVVLVVAMGNLLAAGLPIAVALVGLGAGMSAVSLLSAVTEISTSAPTIATMVGIGVGIDYALLLVTRFAEGLREGMPVPLAAGTATATAGESALMAGTTVITGLLGLRFAGMPIFASFGYATLVVVLAVTFTAVTLVPALCGLAGARLLRRRDRRRLAAGARAHGIRAVRGSQRWALRVGRHPVPWALAALTLLLALAAPTLTMRTWPQDAGSQPDSKTTRRAYDLVTDGFGAGANGPLLIVADRRAVPPEVLDPTLARLASAPGIASATPPAVDEAAGLTFVTLQPHLGPQDPATGELVARLRADLPPGVHVTGTTASFVDVAERLDSRLPVVVSFVVGLGLVLLMMMFRAPLVAIKAALMNLLSVAAAYGVMVATFQWGWGAAVLDLPHPVPVSSYVPIIMFAVLFGLSMDYEVFLLSRVRERWLEHGDGRLSVVEGLAGTGRVITCAAAIMISVFGSFAMETDLVVKMTGLGMAVAVLLDATVVRLVLVPATMILMGDANWWPVRRATRRTARKGRRVSAGPPAEVVRRPAVSWAP